MVVLFLVIQDTLKEWVFIRLIWSVCDEIYSISTPLNFNFEMLLLILLVSFGHEIGRFVIVDLKLRDLVWQYNHTIPASQ